MMRKHIHDDTAALIEISKPVTIFPTVHSKGKIHIAETDSADQPRIKQFLAFFGLRHGATDKTDRKKLFGLFDEFKHFK